MENVDVFGIEITITDFYSFDSIKICVDVSCDDADYVIYLKTIKPCFNEYCFYNSFLTDNETETIIALTASILKAKKIKDDDISKEKVLKKFFEALEDKALAIYKSMNFNL